MDNPQLLKRIVIFSMILIFVVTTVFFAIQIKPNIDYILFLRANPFGGEAKAIRTNIIAELKKIGREGLQYLLINGIAAGIGVFILLSIKPAPRQNKS